MQIQRGIGRNNVGQAVRIGNNGPGVGFFRIHVGQPSGETRNTIRKGLLVFGLNIEGPSPVFDSGADCA